MASERNVSRDGRRNSVSNLASVARRDSLPVSFGNEETRTKNRDEKIKSDRRVGSCISLVRRKRIGASSSLSRVLVFCPRCETGERGGGLTIVGL